MSFFDSVDNEIILSAYQFDKFIRLYAKELEEESCHYGDPDNKKNT